MPRPKQKQDDGGEWARGYLCAVAQLAKLRDPLDSDVIDLLGSLCGTVEKARALGVDEEDIQLLMPVWEHFAEQERRVSAKGD